MVAVIERRSSASARWSRRLASFALVLLLVAAVSHRFGLLETIAYFWVLGLVVALALLALILAATGFARLWEFGDRGGRASLAGALTALLVLAPFAYGASLIVIYPRLNDISTDVENPPLLDGRRRDAAMNPVRPITAENGALQEERYPAVTGRRYDFAAERTVEAALEAAGILGWDVVENTGLQEEMPQATIQIVTRSALFGFPSDMAVRIVDEGESSYVDVRSASRYGMHDLGSNAYRIGLFLKELDRIMTGATGL